MTSFVPPKLLPQLAMPRRWCARADPARLTVSALIPNSRGAERGIALGVHEMKFVLSVSEGHNRSNVAQHRRVGRGFSPRRQLCRERAARPPRSIAGWRPRSAARSRARSTRTGRAHRHEVAEAGADGSCSPNGRLGQPAAIGRVFRKVIADVAPLPVVGAFPRHARPRPGQRAGRLRRRVPSFDASLGGLGGCPYRRARPATSCSKNGFMFEAMGVATGIESRSWRGARDRATRCPE